MTGKAVAGTCLKICVSKYLSNYLCNYNKNLLTLNYFCFLLVKKEEEKDKDNGAKEEGTK